MNCLRRIGGNVGERVFRIAGVIVRILHARQQGRRFLPKTTTHTPRWPYQRDAFGRFAINVLKSACRGGYSKIIKARRGDSGCRLFREPQLGRKGGEKTVRKGG